MKYPGKPGLLSIVLALVISSPLSSQAERPLDLSGLWVRDDGGVVRISQDGQKIKAIHVELSVPVRDVFGFRPGDDHMTGILDGQQIRGKMFVHLPVEWKSRCPEQWAHLSDIELTVSEDGNTIEGRWERTYYSDRDCSLVRKEWQPRKYTRVQPAVSGTPGRLSVVTTGTRLGVLQLELILDASGSMWGKVGARTKIDIAKEVMTQVIENLPDDIEVALRVYGHRISPGKAGACEDSELLFPFAKIDKPRLLQRVRMIRALGTTPIAYSLGQVARDFGGASGEKMVILITDGKEECGGSPPAAVSDLLAKGLKVQVNIVGLALADEATKWEVQRVAELSGGRFFDAPDATALRGAIEQALAAPYDVLEAEGKRIVGGGRVGQGAITLREGTYTVVVHVPGDPIKITNVRVVQNKSTTVELEKQGEKIGIRIVGP
ncbi:MAG: VWA domain-containing protein [candidate division NC10 bacterium]|nr:VWA domain-containing protein [candidate division NC10 bacterium]